jgi:hypothetical protein
MFTFMTMIMNLSMFMFMDTDRDRNTELLICSLMFTNRMAVCRNDDKKFSPASLVYR